MSGHSGISKIISVAALLFTLAACTSTVQPRPHQRPASADPVPASSRVAAPPSQAVNVAVAGLAVDGHPVTSGQQVIITGPAAARRVSGRFTAAAPAGDRFFALTTPLSSAASYVQGEIGPAAGGSWSAIVSIGPNGSYPTHPDRVTIVLASPSVAATLASYEGRPGTLRPVPALTWQTLATITVTRKPPPPASSPAPSASPSPVVAVAGLAVDGHPVTSGQQGIITGPAAARQVSGRFTAAAPAGDRFFALTTPLTSASTAGRPAMSKPRSSREPAGPGRLRSASAPTGVTPLIPTG